MRFKRRRLIVVPDEAISSSQIQWLGKQKKEKDLTCRLAPNDVPLRKFHLEIVR